MRTTSFGQACSSVTTVSGTTVPTLTVKLTSVIGRTSTLRNACVISVRCSVVTLMFVELVDVLPVVLAALSDVVLAALPVDRFVEPEAALPEVALLPVPEVAALPVRSVEPVAALPEAEPLPVVELPPEVVFAALPVRSVLL